MHPARPFLETAITMLITRARAHPFALVCATDGTRVHAAHAPVLRDETDGTPALRFDLCAANPTTIALMERSNALIVFTDDHACVSPDWYGQDDQVGTWNYLSVETEGPVTRLDARIDEMVAGIVRVFVGRFRVLEAADLEAAPGWGRKGALAWRARVKLRQCH